MEISQAVFESTSRIIDTHCHYNMPDIWPNWPSVWKQAQENGVVASWIPGTSFETSRRAVEIAQQDENLWALVGVHPTEFSEEGLDFSQEINGIKALAQSSDKVIGIGEIGLDYFRMKSSDLISREEQRKWCKAQLEIAQELGLFATLHVRDQQVPEERTQGNAYWDIVSLIDETNFSQDFILHCASGPLSYVQTMLDKGAYVSFAGNITYPSAARIREIFALTPPSRRLIETDAPFLAPQEFRGQPCEPWMIVKTAEFMQTLTS